MIVRLLLASCQWIAPCVKPPSYKYNLSSEFVEVLLLALGLVVRWGRTRVVVTRPLPCKYVRC